MKRQHIINIYIYIYIYFKGCAYACILLFDMTNITKIDVFLSIFGIWHLCDILECSILR